MPGERQRVLLARALAQDAPVLLLEEPTASLDVNLRIETLELVADLVADGKTVVAAVHDLGLAAQYCDELLLLADGEPLASGPPEQVLSEARLADTFDANAVVSRDGTTGNVSVTALADSPDEGATVHVVVGGETGARVLDALGSAGFDRTAGPLPTGDAAAATARVQGIDLVTTSPYDSVDGATLDDVADRIAAADVTVLADPVVTPGNRDVLGVVGEAQSLVVVEARPFEERNTAGGSARDVRVAPARRDGGFRGRRGVSGPRAQTARRARKRRTVGTDDARVSLTRRRTRPAVSRRTPSRTPRVETPAAARRP
jgi:iron complex transport system ATP-binding protein